MSPKTGDPARLSVWQLATAPETIRRAIGFALVVGSVLVAINHGGAILAGEVEPKRWLQIGLTTMVPFLVSLTSSVLAVREPGAERTGR